MEEGSLEPNIDIIEEEINQENGDTPFFDVDHGSISEAAGETMKFKQNKITEVFQSIVRKHNTSSKNNKKEHVHSDESSHDSKISNDECK